MEHCAHIARIEPIEKLVFRDEIDKSFPNEIFPFVSPLQIIDEQKIAVSKIVQMTDDPRPDHASGTGNNNQRLFSHKILKVNKQIGSDQVERVYHPGKLHDKVLDTACA